MNGADPTARAEILEVTTRLGEEFGTEGLTMRGIAGRLKISATQIYQHFDGKRAILDELRLRALVDLLGTLTAGLDEGAQREALVRVGRRYVDWAIANPWRYQLLMENETLADSDFSAEQRELFVRVNQETTARLAERAGAGAVPEAARARLIARWWAFLHGTVALILNRRIRADQPAAPVNDVDLFIDEAVEALTDMLLDSVARHRSDAADHERRLA